MSLKSATYRPLRHSRGKSKFAPITHSERRYDPSKRVSRRQPRRSRGKCKHLRDLFIKLNRRGPWTVEEKKEHIRRIRNAVNRGFKGLDALPPAKVRGPKFKPEPKPESQPEPSCETTTRPRRLVPVLRNELSEDDVLY